MKTLTAFRLAPAVLLFLGCFSDKVSSPENPSRLEGAASTVIQVGKIGSLTKTSAAQEIQLTRLRITLSAFGEKEINDTFLLSGNNPITFAKTYTGMGADKRWTLTARTFDVKDSIIHMGVVSFLVENRKTAVVKLDLSSKFSWLTANFHPIRDSVNRVAMLVDNMVRADAYFERQTKNGDTVTLNYDYMQVGRRNIKLHAYGIWNGLQTLLYAADTSINVVAGVDAMYWINLKWVGPRAAPIGAAHMTVTLGSVGHVVFNGHLLYNHEEGYRYYKIVFEDLEDHATRSNKHARMKLNKAYFKADGMFYPEEGGFEIVFTSPVEAGGEATDIFKGNGLKKGWLQFKELDWTVVLDMKRPLKFETAMLEAENLQDFRNKGFLTIYAADDLMGPWVFCGQMPVARFLNAEVLHLKY